MRRDNPCRANDSGGCPDITLNPSTPTRTWLKPRPTLFGLELSNKEIAMRSIIEILSYCVITSILVFMAFRVMMVADNPYGNGIIGVPNYEHAVLICGDKHNEVTKAVADVGSGELNHYWNDQYGAWTVNAGHINDPEIEVLKEIATYSCGYKVAERPWYQRFMGVAGHNHFIAGAEIGKIHFHGYQQCEDEDVSDGCMFTTGLKEHMESCDHDFNTILVY